MAQRVSATDSATRQSLASVRIGLLGPLTIDKDGQRIELSGPKRRALLTLLSLHIDDPLGREQIIEALWLRRQTGREDSTLRVHISHLRDELEPEREGSPKVLLTRGQAYMLSGHVVGASSTSAAPATVDREAAEGVVRPVFAQHPELSYPR